MRTNRRKTDEILLHEKNVFYIIGKTKIALEINSLGIVTGQF